MKPSTITPTKSLGAIRRQAVDLSHFNPIRESTTGPDQPLPLVMEPATDQVDLADWVRNNREYIAKQLHSHGGILFRGFSLKTPQDFEGVAVGIYNEIYSEYGDLPRENAGGKIYTSTPYPEDKRILYHNESSHMNRWATRISFFCVVAAKEGGCSPVVDCRKVYQQLDPAVRQKFEDKGLMYVRNFSDGLDVNWQHFFQTTDKAVVEEACAKQGFICEWVSDDHLRVKQRCRGVLRHPVTGEMSFFNQVQLHHVYCLDPDVRTSLLSIYKREDLPRHVYFGDGTEITDTEMDHVGEIYEKNAVRFTWREGDMVSLDNMIVAHARDSFVGPRKIVVALGDLVDGAEVDRANAARA
ncbi:MAG TPA: TauD/TfdA family dioxygenase [Candidatus Angelobacter sp.]|nr:TauD/TfdA family dioxygenase [Candidatus Angelobacter sp.]